MESVADFHVRTPFAAFRIRGSNSYFFRLVVVISAPLRPCARACVQSNLPTGMGCNDMEWGQVRHAGDAVHEKKSTYEQSLLFGVRCLCVVCFLCFCVSCLVPDALIPVAK